jgi:curved DNA-binding protein CbpA
MFKEKKIYLVLLLLLISLSNIFSAKKNKRNEENKDKRYEGNDETFDEYFEYFQNYAEDFADDIRGMNPYSELSIPPWSTFAEVKKRYLSLVKKYHPDKVADQKDSSEKFMRIQKAYDKIKKKRKIDNDEDFEETTMKNLINVLSERIVNVVGLLGIFAAIKGLLWLLGTIFEFIYSIAFNLLISHLIIDTFVAHLFTNPNHVIITELVFGYFISCFFKSKKNKHKKINKKDELEYEEEEEEEEEQQKENRKKKQEENKALKE